MTALYDDQDAWGMIRILVWLPHHSKRQTTSGSSSRATLDNAYTRLRETVETKDVTEQSRHAALEALETAKAQIELERAGQAAPPQPIRYTARTASMAMRACPQCKTETMYRLDGVSGEAQVDHYRCSACGHVSQEPKPAG